MDNALFLSEMDGPEKLVGILRLKKESANVTGCL
jgi:hypothetical protein